MTHVVILEFVLSRIVQQIPGGLKIKKKKKKVREQFSILVVRMQICWELVLVLRLFQQVICMQSCQQEDWTGMEPERGNTVVRARRLSGALEKRVQVFGTPPCTACTVFWRDVSSTSLLNRHLLGDPLLCKFIPSFPIWYVQSLYFLLHVYSWYPKTSYFLFPSRSFNFHVFFSPILLS